MGRFFAIYKLLQYLKFVPKPLVIKASSAAAVAYGIGAQVMSSDANAPEKLQTQNPLGNIENSLPFGLRYLSPSKSPREDPASERTLVTLGEVSPIKFSSGSNLPPDSSPESLNAAFQTLSKDPLWQYTAVDNKPPGQVQLKINHEDGDRALLEFAQNGAGAKAHVSVAQGAVAGSVHSVVKGVTLQKTVPSTQDTGDAMFAFVTVK